ATFGPHQIIDALPLDHERAFDVTRRGDLLEQRAVLVRDDRFQILAEPDDVGVLPAAIIEIDLPVPVAEGEGIDGLGAIVEFVDQRFADRVPERAAGMVAYGKADAAGFRIALDVI